MKLVGIILLAVAAYFVVVKLTKAEKWTGVLYPSRNDLRVHEFVGEFDTLKKCQNHTIGIVDRLDNPNEADWECGLNCEPVNGDTETLVCEKTKR